MLYWGRKMNDKDIRIAELEEALKQARDYADAVSRIEAMRSVIVGFVDGYGTIADCRVDFKKILSRGGLKENNA